MSIPIEFVPCSSSLPTRSIGIQAVWRFHICGWWRRKWQLTPVLLPGKFHGLRSLVDYSPWGRKESDVTEWLHFHSHAYNLLNLSHVPLPFLLGILAFKQYGGFTFVVGKACILETNDGSILTVQMIYKHLG